RADPRLRLVVDPVRLVGNRSAPGAALGTATRAARIGRLRGHTAPICRAPAGPALAASARVRRCSCLHAADHRHNLAAERNRRLLRPAAAALRRPLARWSREMEPLPAPTDVVRPPDAALRTPRARVAGWSGHDSGRCAWAARVFGVAARRAAPRAATNYLTTSVRV